MHGTMCQQRGTKRVTLGGSGHVYLVGAGPGDPGLLTLAGAEALRTADVVVYDRLAPPELLDLAPAQALRINVGKSPGAHTLGQAAINAQLVDHAQAGRTVVRLKGGDPFVFGRGGEEALHLRANGIPFTVIPGVSSAIAAAAYAGIPVTQRGVADSLLIATGHGSEDASAEHDWPALAGADTLVFLMGVERLEELTRRLLDAGRPPHQPAALVRMATTTGQETIVATLATISEIARARALRPPAVLIVGPVVALRDHLAWFEQRPLFSARVLVTRGHEGAEPLAQRLRRLGAIPVHLPVVDLSPVADTSMLDRELLGLSSYDWVVFTSAQTVRVVMERLEALGNDARAFGGVRICAVGPATAAALRGHGLRPDLIPNSASAENAALALVEQGVQGARVLFPHSDKTLPVLSETVTAAGAWVSAVIAYCTTAQDVPIDPAFFAAPVDIVTLMSPSAVSGLVAAVGDQRWWLAQQVFITIGPTTSAAATAAGLTVAMESPTHTMDGLIGAVSDYWQGRHRLPGDDPPLGN